MRGSVVPLTQKYFYNILFCISYHPPFVSGVKGQFQAHVGIFSCVSLLSGLFSLKKILLNAGFLRSTPLLPENLLTSSFSLHPRKTESIVVSQNLWTALSFFLLPGLDSSLRLFRLKYKENYIIVLTKLTLHQDKI